MARARGALRRGGRPLTLSLTLFLTLTVILNPNPGPNPNPNPTNPALALALPLPVGAADGAARRAFEQCAESAPRVSADTVSAPTRDSTEPAALAGGGGVVSGRGGGGGGGSRDGGSRDGGKRLRLPGYFSALLRLALAAATASEDRRRGKGAAAAEQLGALLAKRWMRSSDLFKGLDQDGSGLVDRLELANALPALGFDFDQVRDRVRVRVKVRVTLTLTLTPRSASTSTRRLSARSSPAATWTARARST